MRRLVALALVAALPACTVGVRRSATPSRSASPAPALASPPACPTEYAQPDPKRPRIALTFAIAADHRTVTGTEHVVFTPDLPVTELVFRLWPNGPENKDARVAVTRASLPMTTEPRGGTKERPTLLRLRLPRPAAAGTRLSADLAFTITLPVASPDRWGGTPDLAWFATAHPLLAWERGRGWATEDAVALLGETYTSEVADYDVTVTAPVADTVLGNAFTDGPLALPDGRRRWHFHHDRARDVAVAAGQFEIRDRSIDGVPVRLAVSADLRESTTAEAAFGQFTELLRIALPAYVTTFGRYPFDSLTVIGLKAIARVGIEYPGLFFVGASRYDVVVPHELAHQWFYGLVGNDQGRDPWLDEAFATYAETVEDPTQDFGDALLVSGDVGKSMAYWNAHAANYSRVVYGKGAGALQTAREANRPLFDALLRCYVAARAYAIAVPADLARALAPMPAALEILRNAGAIAS